MPYTPEDIARVRAEIEAGKQARLDARIRALRSRNRLHQKEIAALTGVSVAYVERVTGERTPPLFVG